MTKKEVALIDYSKPLLKTIEVVVMRSATKFPRAFSYE